MNEAGPVYVRKAKQTQVESKPRLENSCHALALQQAYISIDPRVGRKEGPDQLAEVRELKPVVLLRSRALSSVRVSSTAIRFFRMRSVLREKSTARNKLI